MKEQLTQLIEAYAAARASGNNLLQQFAAGQLGEFLGQIDVIKVGTDTSIEASVEDE